MLLSYRLPREPSTPRIGIWRKLKRLGVAQLGDGLIALPSDARTREHLDWIAEEVVEAGGSASLWVAHPASLSQERDVAQDMAAARAAEYRRLSDDAEAQAREHPPGSPGRIRALRRLRNELRRIQRRDYFPPAERDAAQAAVEALQPSETETEETA
ncbi:Chromate resistance protein ChrB [Kribbella sp. DT2]